MFSNSEKEDHNLTKLGSNVVQELKINQRRILIDSLEIGIPAPEQIIALGERQLPNGVKVGQLLNSKTLNYKKFTPHRDGLFCERIFGPVQSFVCACGKKKESVQDKSRSKNTIKVVESALNEASLCTQPPEGHVPGQPFPKIESLFCTKCQVEYISKNARRHRLGYIKLFAPVTHIWYLKGRPSYLSLFLGKRKKALTSLVYCNAYLVEQAYSDLEIQNSFSNLEIQNSLTHVTPDHFQKQSALQIQNLNKAKALHAAPTKQKLKVFSSKMLLGQKLVPQLYIPASFSLELLSSFSKEKEVLKKKKKEETVRVPQSCQNISNQGESLLEKEKQAKFDLKYKKKNDIKEYRYQSVANFDSIDPKWGLQTRSAKLLYATDVLYKKKVSPTLISLSRPSVVGSAPKFQLLSKSKFKIEVGVGHTLKMQNFRTSQKVKKKDQVGALLAKQSLPKNEIGSTGVPKQSFGSQNEGIKKLRLSKTFGFGRKHRNTVPLQGARENEVLTKSYIRSQTLPFLPSLICPFHLRDSLISFLQSSPHTEDIPISSYCHKPRRYPLCDIHKFLAELKSTNNVKRAERLTTDAITQFIGSSNSKHTHFSTTEKPLLKKRRRLLNDIVIHNPRYTNLIVKVKNRDPDIINLRFALLRLFSKRYLVKQRAEKSSLFTKVKTSVLTKIIEQNVEKDLSEVRSSLPYPVVDKSFSYKASMQKRMQKLGYPFKRLTKHHKAKFCKELRSVRQSISYKPRSLQKFALSGSMGFVLQDKQNISTRKLVCSRDMVAKKLNKASLQERLLFIVFGTKRADKNRLVSLCKTSKLEREIDYTVDAETKKIKSLYLKTGDTTGIAATTLCSLYKGNVKNEDIHANFSLYKERTREKTKVYKSVTKISYPKTKFLGYQSKALDRKTKVSKNEVYPKPKIIQNLQFWKEGSTAKSFQDEAWITSELIEKFITSYLRVNKGSKSKSMNKASSTFKDLNFSVDLPFFLSGSKRNTLFFIVKKEKKVEWILNEQSLLNIAPPHFNFIKKPSNRETNEALLSQGTFRIQNGMHKNFATSFVSKSQNEVYPKPKVIQNLQFWKEGSTGVPKQSFGSQNEGIQKRSLSKTEGYPKPSVLEGRKHSEAVCRTEIPFTSFPLEEVTQLWSCVLVKTFLVSEQLVKTLPKDTSGSFISLKVRRAWFNSANSMNSKALGVQTLYKAKLCMACKPHAMGFAQSWSKNEVFGQQSFAIQSFALVPQKQSTASKNEAYIVGTKALHTKPLQDEAFTISKWYTNGAKEILLYTGGGALESLLKRFNTSLFCQFLFGEIQILRKYYKDQVVAEYNKDQIIGEYNLDSSTSKINKAKGKDVSNTIQVAVTDKGANLFCRRIYRTTRRLKIVQLLMRNKRRPEWMMVSVLPVLPPDLRPVLQMGENLIVASDLNTLYQRVIYRNNRHYKGRFLDFHFVSSIHRLVQDAVDRLMENGKGGSTPFLTPGGRPLKSLSDILKGKRGRFRFNLLGKRVDFSGRSVIVVSPNLRIHECGLPREIALELYKYLLIRQLLLQKRVSSIVNAKKLIKQRNPLIWNILREIIYYHPLLLNRAPTLHRLGIQAFQPKLTLGSAILLHPLVCAGFNADFDGDQMGVHLPLSPQARAEAWDLLWSRNNLLSPATGQPILLPSQDMVLGFYYMTALLPSGTEFRSTLNSSAVPSKNKKVKVNSIEALLHEASTKTRGSHKNLRNLSHSYKPIEKLPAKQSFATIPYGQHVTSSKNMLIKKKNAQRFITIPALNKMAYNGTISKSKSLFKKQGNLPVVYVFSDQFQVVLAYQKKQIDIHTPIWYKWAGKSENEEKGQIPLEVRIDTFGYTTQIYSTHKYKNKVCKDANISFLSLYIRTTVGRVLVNNLIKKHT